MTGGWTGIGSGYPSAFGYMSPTDQGSVYIAPNMTFDFTEIEFQHKTVAEAEADWAAQFNALSANAAGTPIVVWPFHDYGAAAWNTHDQFAHRLALHHADVHGLHRASVCAELRVRDARGSCLPNRCAAEGAYQLHDRRQRNHRDGHTGSSAPDVGEMSLNVINGGTQVIQNVTNWYAYNTQELFLPRNGGTFTVNLGTTQDAVTHIASLPMRGDLLSVTGDGLNLKFSMVGDGHVVIDLGPHANTTPIVTGATISKFSGNVLDLTLSGPGQHDVSVSVTPLLPNRILFQNNNGSAAVWQVSGTALGAASLVGPNPGPFWSLVGTAAFFAGDTGDYLWRGADGSVALWQVNGTTVGSQSAVIAANPGPTWHIEGTGDFYRDGHTDILWQNDNGSVALWDMNGAAISQAGVVAQQSRPDLAHQGHW